MIEKLYSLAREIKRKKYPGKALVNSMYDFPGTAIITTRNIDYLVVDNCKFLANDQIDSIQRVEGNPWFRNIRPTDVCLDIGANIGAITVPLAKRASKVYAVEPLFSDLLKANIDLNELTNIEILKCGVGPLPGKVKVEFGPRKGFMELRTLQSLLDDIGRVDWLKVDGEGCEWTIPLVFLKGIREIRVEFHIRRNSEASDYKLFGIWRNWLQERGYHTLLERGAVPGPCVPFKECILLNASLRDKGDTNE